MIGGRMKDSDYATFIGQTFTHEVKMAKNPILNGRYQLRILDGNLASKVCTKFRAELHQTLDCGAKMPVIVYPPSKGERADHRKGAKLRVDEKIIEIASMSGMMRASVLLLPQTPAVVFKLAHKQASQDEITYTDEDGASVTQDDIAEYFDEVLGDSGTVYVRGSDGHRYLVSVAVTFERVGED
jgi:hypothetical protein